MYDGDGRRVAKANASQVPYKLYLYGSGGEILAETDGAGNNPNEYIFFGGKRIAMLPTGSTVQFYVEDSLGSSRIVTSSTGVLCYDADFYPYGGERPVTDTCTQNNYKFEGKERDTETGNDDFGARYYSNRFGRWLSADWSNVPVAVPYANLTNPQTLNLYAMVADDPESFADLDGHCIQDASNAGCLDALTTQSEEAAARAAQQQAAQKKKGPGFFKRLGQRLKNGFTGHGFKTNEQLLPEGTVTIIQTIHEPNPAVTAAADGAGLVGTLVGGKTGNIMGIISSIASLKNDPSGKNAALTALSFIPGAALGMGLMSLPFDLKNAGVELPKLDLDPPNLYEKVPDGNGHLVPDPQQTFDSGQVFQ